jgi:hypothetical protein
MTTPTAAIAILSVSPTDFVARKVVLSPPDLATGFPGGWLADGDLAEGSWGDVLSRAAYYSSARKIPIVVGDVAQFLPNPYVTIRFACSNTLTASAES